MAEVRNPPIIDVSAGAPANGTVLVYDLATDTWVATAIASVGALVVPQAHVTEPTQTAIDAPAGGTGAAAGGWDTAVHRDAAIAAINATVTDVAAIITWIDATQAKLVTAGILS